MSLQTATLQGLVSLLRTKLPDFKWLTDPSEKNVALPYGVLYLIPGGGYQESFFGSNHPSYVFQISCVGRPLHQATSLMDRVYGTILAQTPSGGWVNDLPISGGFVIGRSTDGSTPGSESGGTPGEAVQQVAQRFILTVTA